MERPPESQEQQEAERPRFSAPPRAPQPASSNGFEAAREARPEDVEPVSPEAPEGARGVLRRERQITRDDVYAHPVVRGREVRETVFRRAWEGIKYALTSRAEREELAVESRLQALPGVTRANTIAVVSPKGGVGKTTTTFLIGNLLSARARARVVAVDANPDFGTLAALAPDEVRSERSLADLLPRVEEVETAPELRPYMSCLPTGMHLLAAPADAELMAVIGADGYDRLLDLLSRFYDIVILDLGTGITAPVSQWAVGRADQLIVITTPEWVTSANVSGALRHLPMEDATLVLNQAGRNAIDRRAVEEHFRKQWLERRVTIPYDQQLRLMLDSGTYSLGALSRATRLPIKQLGVAVGESLA
jgi:putative peptide zinc metalloprotease protein